MKNFIMFLNDEYNEWYRGKIQEFVKRTSDLKKHPEKWENFKFDINQAKIDTCLITDDEVVKTECPSHLQTDANILCIGRQTVYENINKGY